MWNCINHSWNGYKKLKGEGYIKNKYFNIEFGRGWRAALLKFTAQEKDRNHADWATAQCIVEVVVRMQPLDVVFFFLKSVLD